MRSRSYVARTRHSLAGCLLITLFVVCGCVELDEITQYAKASQDVGKSFPGIAEAAEASCVRANSFIVDKNKLPPLDCKIYAVLQPQLVKINSRLFEYIASLGKLATADVSKAGGEFDHLSTDLLAGDPHISTDNQNKASAVSGLAKAITNLVLGGYRQRELEKLIGENDKAVHDVSDFLSGYALDKYHQSFADEWRYEDMYCQNMASDAEPLASELLKRKCAADKVAISAQLKAVEDYQKALATIEATHQKLKDERGHWDPVKLAQELGPGIASLGSAAVSVHKAF